jgi:hypothetical protein
VKGKEKTDPKRMSSKMPCKTKKKSEKYAKSRLKNIV